MGIRDHPSSLATARRILVCRPDEIGDVVLSTAFLRELRRSAPQARIWLLVKHGCVPLLRGCPYVDEVRSLDFRPRDDARYRLRLAATAVALRLRSMPLPGFDMVLLPRRDADWYGAELAAHLVAGRGAVRLHRERVVRNSVAPPPSPPASFAAFSNPRVEHEVLHNLHFLEWCGGKAPLDPALDLWISPSEAQRAQRWLEDAFGASPEVVAIHPSGGRSPLKQWPIANFRRLLERLLESTSCVFLLIGGPDEPWLEQAMQSVPHGRVRAASGAFDLRQLAAVLSRCRLFIGGDSGPMHVAAAAGTSVLALFGPSSVERFGPCGTEAKTLSIRYPCSPDAMASFENRCQTCRFGDPRCLIELEVESVAVEARAALRSMAAAASPPRAERTAPPSQRVTGSEAHP